MQEAIRALPDSPDWWFRPTPLGTGLERLCAELEALEAAGVDAAGGPGLGVLIYLATDGNNTDPIDPVEMAGRLTRRCNARFLVISLAETREDENLLVAIAQSHPLGRIITLENALKSPGLCVEGITGIST